MTTASERALASCERRYRELAHELAQIGYVASGSIAQRSTRCGKDTCACGADPPRLHGPYWHFTAKVHGKTVNKRLSDREARLYEEWIANDRLARDLLAEMRTIAAEAQALILAEESAERGRPPRRRAAPEKRTTFTRAKS